MTKFEEFLQNCVDPPGFRFSKATGTSATSFNGVYKRTNEIVNDRAVYIKLDSEVTPRCCWYVNREWTVSSTAHKDANRNAGFAHAKATGLAHPVLPGEAWNVLDDGEWVGQPEVKVQVLTAADLER